MRVLSWVLRVALFVVVLLFAAANVKTNVELNLGVELVSAPLVLWLLIFFAAGVAGGLLAAMPALFRQRRELARLSRLQGLAARTAATSAPTAPSRPPT
jgi:uncharacterized integral membrane protein